MVPLKPLKPPNNFNFYCCFGYQIVITNVATNVVETNNQAKHGLEVGELVPNPICLF
jgi:hypothetical protein